jgi:hypothetical protein
MSDPNAQPTQKLGAGAGDAAKFTLQLKPEPKAD